MVNFIIGRENVDLTSVWLDNRYYYKRYKKPEWFTTDFAQRVIKTEEYALCPEGYTA